MNTTAKKFTCMLRFDTVLAQSTEIKTLKEIGSENKCVDQVHFVKEFKQFAGETSENFRQIL